MGRGWTGSEKGHKELAGYRRVSHLLEDKEVQLNPISLLIQGLQIIWRGGQRVQLHESVVKPTRTQAEVKDVR